MDVSLGGHIGSYVDGPTRGKLKSFMLRPGETQTLGAREEREREKGD